MKNYKKQLETISVINLNIKAKDQDLGGKIRRLETKLKKKKKKKK